MAFIESLLSLAELPETSPHWHEVMFLQNNAKPNIPGVDTGTHPLTHHGNQPAKLEQQRRLEEAQFKELATLLRSLDERDAVGVPVSIPFSKDD